MTRIVTLGKETAIKKIENEIAVYLRHGVWDKYELYGVGGAIESIKNSGYGADIYYNDDNGMFYVSIPCNSDMW